MLWDVKVLVTWNSMDNRNDGSIDESLSASVSFVSDFVF